MSHVTPVMAIVTAIISIAMDPWHDFRASRFFDSSAHIIRSSLLLLLGGALAFFMVCIMCSFSVNNIYARFSLRIIKVSYYSLMLKISFQSNGMCNFRTICQGNQQCYFTFCTLGFNDLKY